MNPCKRCNGSGTEPSQFGVIFNGLSEALRSIDVFVKLSDRERIAAHVLRDLTCDAQLPPKQPTRR